MVRRITVTSVSLVVSCLGTTTGLAQSRCDIAHYIFQDQDGIEAIVKNIKECFGWFDRDRPSMSSHKNACYTEDEAGTAVKTKERKSQSSVRLVGSRVFTILYQDKFLNIVETAIVGSPWLSYEVDPDLGSVNFSMFKEGGKVYELLGGGEVKFDFTEDAPRGFDTPAALYKNLLGKQFIFKRCQKDSN